MKCLALSRRSDQLRPTGRERDGNRAIRVDEGEAERERVVFFDVGIYFRPISGIPRHKYPPCGSSAGCATSAGNERSGRERKKKERPRRWDRARARTGDLQRKKERFERERERERESQERKKAEEQERKIQVKTGRHATPSSVSRHPPPLASRRRAISFTRSPRVALVRFSSAVTRVEAANLVDLRSTARLPHRFLSSAAGSLCEDSRRAKPPPSLSREDQARQALVSIRQAPSYEFAR